MIANRRSWGTTSRKSWSRLPATSVAWIDSPVTLPPGRARFVTKPPPTGSCATAKTMGMTVVARFTVGTAVPNVTMTSTLRRTNSAATSASARGVLPPSDIRSRWCDPRSNRVHAVVSQRQPSMDPRTEVSRPGTRQSAAFPTCCARAASGHAAAVPPTNVMKSRRLIAFPDAQDRHRSGLKQQRRKSGHVRFGSKADMCSALAHVCFTPQSGHVRCKHRCPLSANSGHLALFDYLVGAGEQAGGTVRPIALADFKLMTSSYLVGSCMGSSAGFSPLRILST